MKKILLLSLSILALLTVGIYNGLFLSDQTIPSVPEQSTKKALYWFILDRKSNTEYLYQGVPGDTNQSQLIKKFNVKVGIPGQRPTPLPQKLGREYWLVTQKFETKNSPETAPYFLMLDIPFNDEYPYGPTPYNECNGQCNWQLPGSFGLHGIAGDSSKLLAENPGSSGCIRHSDEDITYLYHLLSPEQQEVRYYIHDS